MQVKWLIMEIIRHVHNKADHPAAKAWLANNRPSYTWYRRFLWRHRDRIRSRVVENLDPKRWKVSLPAVKSLYDVMQQIMEDYPGLPAANICNLDETNLTPERRKSRVLATGLWPVDFDRVRDQVYNLAGEEEATDLEQLRDQPASTRESRVSKRAHEEVEQEVQNRPLTSEEVRMEAQVIQKRRELAKLEEKLVHM